VSLALVSHSSILLTLLLSLSLSHGEQYLTQGAAMKGTRVSIYIFTYRTTISFTRSAIRVPSFSLRFARSLARSLSLSRARTYKITKSRLPSQEFGAQASDRDPVARRGRPNVARRGVSYTRICTRTMYNTDA